MVNRLRNIISEYMTRYSDTGNWEETRFLYSVYSYLAFLVIALDSMGIEIEDIRESAAAAGLEDRGIIEYLLEQDGSDSLTEEMLQLVETEKTEDVNELYQEFLSVDYVVKDHQVLFEGGKNNRDTLGSYYTQEDFAFEITKAAIDKYLDSCKSVPKELRIADFSCGGGAFLAAAGIYCAQRNVQAALLGIDVDPIAVMITRARLCCQKELKNGRFQIVLGNPLLKESRPASASEAFSMALKGRYYHSYLGAEADNRYDIVIGNPPWEKIRFEEKKFLAHYVESSLIAVKQKRKEMLEQAAEVNRLFFNALLKDYEYAKAEIKKSSVFKQTSCGELNTYALFTEYALAMLADRGVIGLIVKSSLLKMPVYSSFLKSMMDTGKVHEIYMFVNRNRIFNIDSREEFSVLFLMDQNQEPMKIAVNLDDYRQFYIKEKIELSQQMLELLNPETGMLPNIRNQEELEFLCRIYSSNPVFGQVYKDCRFGRLVHLTNHSNYIVNENRPGYLPVYEGKFIELYTGKYATFGGMESAEKYKNKAAARLIDNVTGAEYPESRYFIETAVWNRISKNFTKDFVIAWRSLTSATNRRTMMATLLPLLPTCQSVQLLQMKDTRRMLHVLALFNSIIFDYIVRLKMAGLDLTQTIVKQIPVPDECEYGKVTEFAGETATMDRHIRSRLRLLYEDDVRVKDLMDDSDCYEIKNIDRKQIIAELDLLAGRLYGLERKEIRRIAADFDKYYTKKEVEQWF